MLTVTRRPSLPHPALVAVTGSATIAVSFGFARYGYGLFVPTFRAEFGLSTGTVGLIGSASYCAYLGGLLGSGWLTARRGPRLPVLVGAAAAALGMTLIALAHGPQLLVAGVILAASSPGWAWAPFADAVAAIVRRPHRQRVLSTISTGTTFGLVVAGPLALLSGHLGSWRGAWFAFAGIALVSGLADAALLPGRSAVRARTPDAAGAPVPRRPRTAPPLLGQAFVYGAVAAVYYTYAVDLVRTAGLGADWSALLWTLVGVGGVAGVVTGDVVARIGLRRALGGCLLLLAGSIALLASAPAKPLVAGVAALAFGLAYMPIAALLALWSQDVHPSAPTAGFTRVLAAMAVGSVMGPLVLGPVADTVGLRVVFVLLAGVTLVGTALRPGSPVPQPLMSTTRNLASPDIIRS